ncbi:MAG: twin-arginine translocation signal domain-containing protein [Verrucomicrobia subdivision 3 bacterium]|nr:twin-arginine translocation signal domain-containing protein [Limisphaerales bacterium]
MKKNLIGNCEKTNRRTFLKTAGAAGAALAAAPALLEQAEAQQPVQHVIYSHGMVWNAALPGIARELLITFDLRAVIGGTGLGTLADSVHPGINSHVAFNSATRQGNVYTLQGTVIRSNDAANVGTAVTVVAEAFGEATRGHIQVGDLTFMGNGYNEAPVEYARGQVRDVNLLGNGL